MSVLQTTGFSKKQICDRTVLAPAGRVGAGAGGEAVMDFYAVPDQVVALLHSRGRVSYRALKLELDNEAIEAL